MTDLTFYPSERTVQERGWGDIFDPDEKARRSVDCLISYEDEKRAHLRRALVCSCYGGKRCSITVRQTDFKAEDIIADQKRLSKPKVRKPNSRRLARWPADAFGTAIEQNRLAANEFFVDALWDEISTAPRRGLIVIAGETGSRKTTLAREMARRHVSALMGAFRPHVVTCEDPIESWFAYTPEEASRHGFEYTPRHKGIDVRNLKDAVADALRQKPALLFVNEVRSADEWSALLDFAGTGHLAITTTHAGSLVETFERLFRAADATTPAKRSHVAGRIVSVVHVKKLGGKLVPTAWVQTTSGRMALTQEGLGSLLPSPERGCYGRSYYARKLLHLGRVRQAAIDADLNGQ